MLFGAVSSGGWAQVGIWRRFVDLFIDPATDFMLWKHHMDAWEGTKAVCRGKAHVFR